MQTIFSGLTHFDDADAAVHELQAANFPVAEINIFAATTAKR